MACIHRRARRRRRGRHLSRPCAPAVSADSVSVAMEVNVAVPVDRSGENIVVPVSADLYRLKNIIRPTIKTAHVIAVQDENVAVLAASKGYIHGRRTGHQDVRAASQIRVSDREIVVIVWSEVTRY